MQIGSIDLRGFEIPSSICLGGRYRLAIHRLASGQRIVERLGPDDNEVKFRGIFSGAEAEARVRDINNLRLSGQSVWLTWKSFRFLVIIKAFFADYRSPWWIPYEICCVVTEQPGALKLTTATLAAQISTDLGTALSILSSSNMQLSELQVALTTSNVAIAGTTDRANAIGAVRASLAAVDGKVNDYSSTLSGPELNTTSASSYANSFMTKVTSAGSLAAAINARSYIARINSNLNNAGA